jgi:uncharacterized protein YlxW (UPF0749 family)
MSTRVSRSRSTNLAIVVASGVLGFLLTVQFRSTAAQMPNREQGRLATVDTVHRLEDEQKDLKAQVVELRAQVSALQHQVSATGATASLAASVDQQKLTAGLVPVRGPGVLVSLDDSSRAVGPADDANNFIIHDYELRDIISLLWLSGAEGITVNGERIVNVSSLYCVGSTILVNDTRLSPPYEVRAIGDPAELEQAIQSAKNLTKLKARVKAYGVQLKMTPQKDMLLPAYTGNLTIRYARPTVVPERPDTSKPVGM